MFMIIPDDSRIGFNQATAADCSPTTSRYGKRSNRRPSAVRVGADHPALTAYRDQVEAVAELVVDNPEHPGMWIRGAVNCPTCETAWPCQPIVDVIRTAAESTRQLVEDFKASHDGAAPGACDVVAGHDSHPFTRDGVALFCLGV